MMLTKVHPAFYSAPLCSRWRSEGPAHHPHKPRAGATRGRGAHGEGKPGSSHPTGRERAAVPAAAPPGHPLQERPLIADTGCSLAAAWARPLAANAGWESVLQFHNDRQLTLSLPILVISYSDKQGQI